jgi:hypothetical protein
VRDGTGKQIGILRGLARDDKGGQAQAMVEFSPLFGRPGKTSVLALEALRPGVADGPGYVVELTPVAYDALPGYALDHAVWRRVGA